MAQKCTTDRDEIRSWIEEHRGVPTIIPNVEEEEERPDMLHISFTPEDPNLVAMGWDEFFDRFENENLALVYDDEAPAEGAPDFEFMDRDRARDEFSPETTLPDTGDKDELRENIIADSDNE